MVNEMISNQTNNTATTRENPSEEIITQKTANGTCVIKMRAVPLPIEVTRLIDQSLELLKTIKEYESNYSTSSMVISDKAMLEIISFKKKLSDIFVENNWDPESVDRIWAFGPRNCGPNILFSRFNEYNKSVWPIKGETTVRNQNPSKYELFVNNFKNGFQLATLAGPLCDEPMMGVGFIVEDWIIDDSSCDNQSGGQLYGPLSGQIVATVKEACKKAFQSKPQRLMVAMYSCCIQVNSEVLGMFYSFF